MNRRPLRSSLRVLAGAFSLLATVSLWQAATPVGVEAAQSDLTFISNSTWRANPTDARVHVLAVVTATSHAVDSGTRRYFYDKIQLTLPSSSDGITAAAGGRQLPVTVLSATGSGVVVLVGFGQRLYSGQSGSFDLKFDLVDSGGSTDRDLRIGHNLMSFPVWAFGSPHTPGSTVTVMFPPGFVVQEEFGGLTRAEYDSGEVVFSSGVVDDSTQLSAWFTAVQPVPPGDYKVRTMTIGSLSVALRYWGDDAAWADQVERVLRAGYPLLRDMIGLGDPLRTTITVEEASTQETGGYGASYDPAGGQIRVSYFADPFTILHETAHMWFNREMAGDRWIVEAFASYYAEQAVVRLGLPDHAPYLTDRMRQAAVPLNDWLTTGGPSSATDAYLYGATLQVAREIAARAGSNELRSVWAAARSGGAAYQPAHGTEPEVLSGGAADWRRLLDLLEQTTGRSFADIFARWVVDPSQKSLLDDRATARAVYHEAQVEAGAWDLPPEIRRALDTWQYPQAMVFIAQARAILTQRDRIASEAATERTTPPSTLQTAFERSGIVVASAEATNELAVLHELAAARQAQTDTGGAARAVGLLGADPGADLGAAREAFSKGDLTTAMSRAARARTAWQTAIGAGEMRIFGSLCVLSGGLLLLILLVWSRGGRQRDQLAGVAAGGASESDSGEARRGEARVCRLGRAWRIAWGRRSGRWQRPRPPDSPRS
jgi:hypothetical protein